MPALLHSLPVCDPAKGDVSHNHTDSKYGHEEGSVLMLHPHAESVGDQVDHGTAAAVRHQQEGGGQDQEVRHQKKSKLWTGPQAESAPSGRIIWE